MKTIPLRRIVLLSGLATVLWSCEEPRLATPKTVEETVKEVAQSPAPAIQEAPVAVPPATPAPAEPAPDLPRAEPELYISIEGDRLIVRGALASRIQQERILETLEREFPDLKIEKDLRLEYHRIPVGWGNRVASPFLVYYLKEVDSPKVSYEDGIVTLDGKAKKGANVRLLTEMAIETFSGDTTRDLVNHLVKQRR